MNGTAGDSLSYHNGMAFSTMDKDNDLSSLKCANNQDRSGGGWWYKSCLYSNLNGLNKKKDDFNGIRWYFDRKNYSLKSAQMAVRRMDFTNA